MPRITLPAGASLRELATRLGVSAEELQRRSGVADIEQPLPADVFVEVPTGFFKTQDRARRSTYSAVPGTPTTKAAGMNAWLALDVERKRIERDGGARKALTDTDEAEAFAEADLTFARLEAASNELAAALYHRLTDSPRTQTRARAFASESMAHAYGHLLFGATRATAQAQALSRAKAALMTDPKLPAAHVALAAALRCVATPQNLVEAQAVLADAAHHGAADRRYAYERAVVAWATRQNDLAPDAEPACALALELRAVHALCNGRPEDALDLLSRACAATPTYLNAEARRAGLLRQLGREQQAADAEMHVLQKCERDYHRTRLMALLVDPALSLVPSL